MIWIKRKIIIVVGTYAIKTAIKVINKNKHIRNLRGKTDKGFSELKQRGNKKMSKAIKLLVAAFESCGKSTLTSAITNALVINLDHKEYGFKAVHANIPSYEGMDELTSEINDKIEAYNDKKGEYPETVIIDTVTQLYSAIQKYNGNRFTGFDIHSNNNRDTLNFNAYIEETLISNGINVIIVAHCMFDAESGRHIIPASGQFLKAGSWMSVVNEALYIEKKSTKLVVHTSSMKFPCRSTLPDLPPSTSIEDFDINAHIKRLVDSKVESIDWVL